MERREETHPVGSSDGVWLTGKTIVFSKIIEDRVRMGERVLVLAHRSELLEQASDKLKTATGLGTALEKAESTSIGSWFRVVVGSVQTMQREKRLSQFPPDYFDTIVIDEAHHAISDGYQRVLQHFESANVLGVTATPDRGDKQNLGKFLTASLMSIRLLMQSNLAICQRLQQLLYH